MNLETDPTLSRYGNTMSEETRLSMLCARDGVDTAREWAQSTLHLYRQSLENPAHFASQADWKARFEHSMRELSTFIEHETLNAHGNYS